MTVSHGASTRRGFNGSAMCALGVALGVALGAACQPQVEIILVRAAGFEATPEFVKFQVKQRGVDGVDEFGPFDLDAIPDEQFAPVAPGTEFSIDVIGCPAPEPQDCVEPGSFNARGCTPTFISVGKDEVKSIEIAIDNAVNGDAICPPQG